MPMQFNQYFLYAQMVFKFVACLVQEKNLIVKIVP